MDDAVFYPRVLIVGQSFDTSTGGGITMSNLFKGWPKERLAVISDLKYYPNADVCNQYYRFGADEYRYIWPLSHLFKHRRSSGKLDMNEEIVDPNISTRMHESWQENTGHLQKQGRFWRLLYAFNELIGAEQIIRRLQLSENLSEWTRNFRPDIIYTQAGCLHEMSLVKQLIETIKVPYVIHMMDDWPSTLYGDTLLAPYLRWRLNKDFLDLLDHSSVFIGISQKMCDIYKQRYQRDCIPFHNPIELDNWLAYTKKDWKASTPFRIMYTGRIGTSIQTSLVDICEAVYELNQDGLAVKFDIVLSPSCDTKTKQRLERPGCVCVLPAIPYKNIPACLAKADLLVLPLDFDRESVKFARYSMPTKAPEFMISGTPVIVYASSELAVTEYARKEKWAYVVSERNISTLKKSLLELINDQALREKLSHRAQALAIQNHDAMQVRTAFRQTLINAMAQ
jgi:glycosyltransferase involved in cell wall biosynthesis